MPEGQTICGINNAIIHFYSESIQIGGAYSQAEMQEKFVDHIFN